MVAIVALGIALPPLLFALRQVASDEPDRIQQLAALSYAEALMEEIASKRFEDPDLARGSFGGEETGRSSFDDVDDFHGLSESPPSRVDGTALDSLGGFTRLTTVENVSSVRPNGPAVGDGSTALKRIRVTVRWTGGRGGELSLSTLRARL